MTRLPDLRRRPFLRSAPLLLMLLLTTPAGASTTRVEASGSGGCRGVLRLAAAPLVTMRPIPFTLVLLDPAGQPTTTPELVCDLMMPAMPMPENRPRLVAGQDSYSGEAVFPMAGAWRLQVAVRRNGSEIDRLSFDLGRVLLK